MSRPVLVYSSLYLPRPLTPAAALALLERLAADPYATRLVFELRSGPAGTEYVLGCRATDVQWLRRLLRQLLPGSALTTLATPRPPMTSAARLAIRPAALALRVEAPEAISRAILAATDQRFAADEAIVLQVLIGPRSRPTHLPAHTTDPRLGLLDALLGVSRPAGADVHQQLSERATAAGFQATIRIGAAGPDRDRRAHFINGLLGAAATTRSPGVRMYLHPIRPKQVDKARQPWWWPLELGAPELLALLGWPLGEGDLPGLPPAHPKRLRPADSIETKQRVFATSAYQGDSRPVGLAIADQMMHGIAYGPSGSGKTTALTHLIQADIDAGRSVCVIDPKHQLIEDLLARIPDDRLDDVVVLNAASPTPIGFNPLDTTGRDPDVVVDGLIAVLGAIFASGWGPRTEDIISAGLRTLARTNVPTQPATLIDLPSILTNASYRRPKIQAVGNDPGLRGFWDWYESLSPRGQAQAIAAPLNKIRSLLLRPALVRILSQSGGTFRLRDIWRQNKIVLVPLNEGLIGQGTASLLGSLIIADVWQATQERATEFGAGRRPGTVYVDEAPRFLHLPVSLADALAVSRSLSVGWFLAAQFRSQFPPDLRAAVDMNARSKVIFATEHADARDFAQMAPDLSADDFMALPKYHAYVNLVAGGHPSGWATVATLPPIPARTDPSTVSAHSEQLYGAPPVAASRETPLDGSESDEPESDAPEAAENPSSSPSPTPTSTPVIPVPGSEPHAPVPPPTPSPPAGVGRKRRVR